MKIYSEHTVEGQISTIVVSFDKDKQGTGYMVSFPSNPTHKDIANALRTLANVIDPEHFSKKLEEIKNQLGE